MRYYRICIITVCLIILHIIISILISRRYSSFLFVKRRLLRTVIESDLAINSFNPSRIDFSICTDIPRSNLIFIIDNNITFIRLSQINETSPITMILQDGFHRIEISVLDPIENIEFYQNFDIATGSQSLLVIVLDEYYKPVTNISVHLELIAYQHISYNHRTNHFGEVIFHYLSRDIQIYIEVICMNSKRHAFVEIDSLLHQNITLILKEIRSEYDSIDEGFYAI